MNGIDKIIARMEADTQAECADIAAQAAAVDAAMQIGAAVASMR